MRWNVCEVERMQRTFNLPLCPIVNGCFSLVLQTKACNFTLFPFCIWLITLTEENKLVFNSEIVGYGVEKYVEYCLFFIDVKLLSTGYFPLVYNFFGGRLCLNVKKFTENTNDFVAASHNVSPTNVSLS